MTKCPFAKNNKTTDESLNEISSEITCESCEDATCENNINQVLKDKDSK